MKGSPADRHSKEIAMEDDPNTSKHPARNAIVILFLLTTASALADFLTGVAT